MVVVVYALILSKIHIKKTIFQEKIPHFNISETFLKNLFNNPTLKLKHKIKEGEIIIMAKIVEVNEKIAEVVVEGYKKIENGVVGGYKKMENGVVEGFGKVTDKCVEKLFTKEGESVEDAKKRLSNNIERGNYNE